MWIAPKLRQRLFRSRPDDQLPLTIEHQRIYILPTARGCAFIAALLLMLVASVNYALSLGYALCFLLTGLFTATLLHTYRNLSGIRLVSIESRPNFAGSDVVFDITLDESRGSDRHSVDIKRSGAVEHRATSTVLKIDGDNASSTPLTVTTHQRGHLTLGRLTVSSTWPLGLWRSWSYLHCAASAIVWPAPEPDAPPLPTAPSVGGAGAQQRTDEGDVASLRDWLPGDAPSRIAWKRAARSGHLHVLLVEAATQPALATLDLAQTRLGSLEAQLSRLTAWVLQAEQQNADYTLQLPESTTGKQGEHAQRQRSLDALALYGLRPL